VSESLAFVTLLLGRTIASHVTVAAALMAIDARSAGAWRNAAAKPAAAHHAAPGSGGGAAATAAAESGHGESIHGGAGVDALGSDDAGGDHPLCDERGTIFRHVTDVLTIVALGPAGRVRAVARNVAGAVARVTEEFRRAVLGHVTQLGALEALDLRRRAADWGTRSRPHVPRVGGWTGNEADAGPIVVSRHAGHTGSHGRPVTVGGRDAHPAAAARSFHPVSHGLGPFRVPALARAAVAAVSVIVDGHLIFFL